MDSRQQGQLLKLSSTIPAELITEAQRQEFFDTFGDHCDRIFVENFAPCWPDFDIEKHTGVKISKGIYQQDIGDTETASYIFYGDPVNADGLVSSCFLDWGRKLANGDVRSQSMKSIWNSAAMNALRLQHLEGRRQQNNVCGNCGQLSHCLPDNIHVIVSVLLEKFNALVSVESHVEPPGGNQPVIIGWRLNQYFARHPALGWWRRQSARNHRPCLPPEVVEQTFVLLEPPRDHRFIDKIRSVGGNVIIADDLNHVASLARKADIVPVRAFEPSANVRMSRSHGISTDSQCLWSHISRLFQRLIPPALIEEAARFVFTTAASLSIPGPLLGERPRKRSQ